MVDAAVLLGVDRDKAKTELKLALEFEIKLANISTPREERRDGSKLYNPTTLGNMKTGPGLPESWTTYVQDLFDLPNVNFKIEATEKVIIMDVNYYANLTKVLGSADNKVIANYLGWRVVETSLQILNDKARSIEEDVYKAMHGTVQAPAIWKMCVHKTKKLFKHAVSSMYVMVYFKPEAKNEINIMINYIRDAFNDILDDIEWLDEDTKESARLKLNFMDQVVGYSDEILEQDKIDGVYEDIEVTKDEYFGNTIRLVDFLSLNAQTTNKLLPAINALTAQGTGGRAKTLFLSYPAPMW
jgi:membrane metallo-endopeptidase-like protein 1